MTEDAAVHRRTIIFDTSGLNALANDADLAHVIVGLNLGFLIRLTETNLVEVGATPDRAKRAHLLQICRGLVTYGEAIRPYNSIIQELIKAHDRDPNKFDWANVSVRSPELEAEIARPEYLGTDEAAEELARDAKTHSLAFESIFREARQAHPFGAGSVRPTLPETVNLLKEKHWLQVSSMYERISGTKLDEPACLAFVESCPAFRAMLLAQHVAHYERCVRPKGTRAMHKAGGLDMFSATYLPYADLFITEDQRQLNAFQTVVAEGALSTQVVSYKIFKNHSLLITAPLS